MKRVISLLLALAFLTGCGRNPTPAEPDTLPEDSTPAATETITLPETGPAGTLSASAVVMEGRIPAEVPALPSAPVNLDDPALGSLPFPALLTELPEAGAALYALGDETVLLQWDGYTAEFGWSYLTPRRIPPRLACLDIDGDEEDELAVACYTGSGTSVSIWTLHIIEKGPDGALTDYALPDSLWQEQVPTLLGAAEVEGRCFLLLGRELVEIDSEAPHLDMDEPPSAGSAASFEFLEVNRMRLSGVVNMSSGYPCYIAGWSAELQYQNGIFTLRDFHLESTD